ncbi:MAG: hypothetical protein FRX48_05101 [Lasallia pustulata]|uniref:Aminoglycoside phosphotransferase domain-containing protein n=1 Tax=Lasallia pustulata TaxID=136370 RepID=A0A5M8PMK8_9LECA|nr:MAG: hypothetical protein FRX48_05101 [Lasallia pustulata]
MDLTTTPNLHTYLTTHSHPIQTLTPLSGGTANFVWRLTSPPAPPTIIKHAAPYIASSPTRHPFPVSRMDFEVSALQTLPAQLPPDDLVRTPQVYSYDAEEHVLMLADGGERTLKAAYTDPGLDVRRCGVGLGRWLAGLHGATRRVEMGDNQAAKVVYRYAYAGLAGAAREYGGDAGVGGRVDREYGSLLQTDDECVCHGDFWPGNVLVGGRGEVLMVVDWEMVRRGCGGTDVGQFAAEAWLLDRFRGGRGLLVAFLAGYREVVGPGRESLKRVAVHFGVHLAFWPTRVEWGSKEETKECVLFGQEVMRRAVDEDWEWLEKSVLKDLF